MSETTGLRAEHPASSIQKSLITAIGRQLKICTSQMEDITQCVVGKRFGDLTQKDAAAVIDELQSALRRQR